MGRCLTLLNVILLGLLTHQHYHKDNKCNDRGSRKETSDEDPIKRGHYLHLTTSPTVLGDIGCGSSLKYRLNVNQCQRVFLLDDLQETVTNKPSLSNAIGLQPSAPIKFVLIGFSTAFATILSPVCDGKMMYSFRESLKAQWHKAIEDVGFAGWILFSIVGVVLLILAIAIVVMCLARKKQREIDDRRTAMDLLERGRLTPVRSKPLPPTPQSRRNGSTTESTRSVDSTKLAVDLSPHPFQQPEDEEIGQDSALTSTAASIPVTTEIPRGGSHRRQESPPSVKEPTPKTILSKENLQAMAVCVVDELQPETGASHDSGSAMDLQPPGAALEESSEAQDCPTSSNNDIEPTNKVDEPPLIHSAPRTARASLGLNAASSLKKEGSPRRFIGP